MSKSLVGSGIVASCNLASNKEANKQDFNIHQDFSRDNSKSRTWVAVNDHVAAVHVDKGKWEWTALRPCIVTALGLEHF